MTTTLAHALAFARRDLGVLPLHWSVTSKTGKLICSCATRTGCGKSAAKHPIGKLAPNGLLRRNDRARYHQVLVRLAPLRPISASSPTS